MSRIRLGRDWDWRVCYQSRVGPMKWLGPYTLDAIEAAGAEGLGVSIAPIAFVSEHVETLVELDHDYAALGAAAGCPLYIRVPALGVRRPSSTAWPSGAKALGRGRWRGSLGRTLACEARLVRSAVTA